jgi:CubicO group peptidase (beta-lactamase class C family)
MVISACTPSPKATEPIPEGFLPADIQVVDDIVGAFMKKYNIPGLSFTVAINDSIKIERCYGYADIDTKELMNPGNLFRIASISKTFTATAIMKLVEQSKLHLQDKVFGPAGILGTTYGTYPYKRWVEEITVEHLLEHLSGGWADYGLHKMKDQGNDRDPVFLHPEMDLDALIGWALDNQPLRYEPGTHFQYSNFGFNLLGRVIEKVTGMKYEEYVRMTVLQPCGITDMQMGGNTLTDRLPGEVHYYDSENDPYTLSDRRGLYSSGGWVATPADLVKFIMRVDKSPQKADILEPATLDTMFSPPAVNPDYAKGWFVNRYGDYSHGGGGPGVQSLVVRTHDGFCGAAIVNTWSYKAVFGDKLHELMRQIRQAISHWPDGEI